MSAKFVQRLMLILFALLCIGVTSLLALNMFAGKRGAGDSPLIVGTGGATLWDAMPAVREFQLVDQQGKPFGSKELRGKVWIASFIFTRCPSVCPKVLVETLKLQETLKLTPQWKDIALVSISVDPQHDTPMVLAEKAAGLGATAGHWHFLTDTGPDAKAAIWKLVSAPDGFMNPVGEAPPEAEMSIIHSSKFMLIDQQHRLRGAYDALKEEDVKRLKMDVLRLVQ